VERLPVTAWSYSSIKTFDQCPKKYYHLRVVKDVKDEGGDAAIYGTNVHKAAEDHIALGAPIPAKYSYIRPVLDVLKAIPGEKRCEIKLGVRRGETGYEPAGFFDADVWWRGIADLLILDDTKAYVVDYKTGKSARYADTKQLDLLAGAVFLHYPQVVSIKSALAFVVSGELVDKVHTVEMRDSYLNVFETQLDRLAKAEETGVWNAVPNALCRNYCPVTECAHNGRR
jgi:hypothetical protein